MKCLILRTSQISYVPGVYQSPMGKFDCEVWYVIIFLYVKFWIRPAAVSKRGEKVRTVAFRAVRSVNKSCDTKLRPKQARGCDLCHLHHSFILQSPRINFVLSDIANTPQFQLFWRWPLWYYRSPHMSVLGTVGAMVTTHENSVMMWSFKGPKLFCVLKTYWKWKRVMDFTLWYCL